MGKRGTISRPNFGKQALLSITNQSRPVIFYALILVLSACLLLGPAPDVNARPPMLPVVLEVKVDEVSGKLPLNLNINLLPQEFIFPRSFSGKVIFSAKLSRVDGTGKPKYPLFRLYDPMRGLLPFEIKDLSPGRYKLDIRVKGQLANGIGFIDRRIRYINVDEHNEFSFWTPPEIVKKDWEDRKNAFEETLTFDIPDIMLLALKSTRREFKIAPVARIGEPGLAIRPMGPFHLIERHVTRHVLHSTMPPQLLTATGRIVFTDYDGGEQPLVSATVNLYLNDDNSFDPVVTDENGNWSIPISIDPASYESGSVGLSYIFYLGNDSLSLLQGCESDVPAYFWGGEEISVGQGQAEAEFETRTVSESPEAAQVWNHLILALKHAETTGGHDPGLVSACYPARDYSTGWYSGSKIIRIAAQYNDSPDVITHEYGHAVMYTAYDGNIPSDGGSHSFWDCEQEGELSWSEGWATAFALSADPDPDGIYNEHDESVIPFIPEQTAGCSSSQVASEPAVTSSAEISIEHFNADCTDGLMNEGRVAAAIYDMMDTTDDTNTDNLETVGLDISRAWRMGVDGHADYNKEHIIPFSVIFRDTLWNTQHDNFHSFWNSLAGTPGRLTDEQRSQAQEIMYYNYALEAPTGSAEAGR